MRKAWLISVLGLVFLLGLCFKLMPVTAEKDGVVYWKAKIVAENKELGTKDVELLSGPNRGANVTTNINASMSSLDMTPPDYKLGSNVFISHNTGSDGKPYYAIVDYYRISSAVWIFFFVLVLAVVFAGWRGLGALLGLVFSIIVISQFLIPNVINGNAPYVVTAIAIMIISLPGIYVAHGVNKRTTIALLSCYITLFLAVVISFVAVGLTRLSGVANEETWLITQLKPGLNIQGLLLCGMLISLVGVLDDVTVGQTVSVYELKRANPKFGTRELYKRGLRIGREHIASLINTLVLVYVGASFLFIVYLSVVIPYPLIMVLNSELIMEEIVRSLVGSAALIMAVPITTIIAAYFLQKDILLPKKYIKKLIT